MDVLAMKLGHVYSCVRVREDCLTCITEVATGDLACQREVSRGDCCFGDRRCNVGGRWVVDE